MVFLRTLAVLLLVSTLLPWGAYSAAKAAPQQPVPSAQTALAADACQAEGTAEAQPDERRAAALPGQCRNGILTGSPCVPDVALFENAAVQDMTRSLDLRFPATAARLTGVVLPGALDPPIAC
jgi:hypothetical protein